MTGRVNLTRLSFAVLIAAIVLYVSIAFADSHAPKAPPQPGVAVQCTISEVYDGDTITVTWTNSARVRLLDCWAPEIRTLDAKEKARGQKSRDHLVKLAEGKPALLWIPTGEASRLDDLITLGRVLGHVWVDGDPESLSAHQVQAGHATTEKPPADRRSTWRPRWSRGLLLC